MRTFAVIFLLVSLFHFGLKAEWYKPSDKGVKVNGYGSLHKDYFECYWPGTGIEFYSNDTTVIIEIEDLGEGGEEHTNYVEVVVNDEPFKTLKLEPFKKEYLIKGLPKNLNKLTFFKRTEAMVGGVRFYGFKLSEPPKNVEIRQKILWVGNSLTCGYGNMVNIAPPPQGNPSTGFHADNENHFLAWGPITSRKLDLDFYTIAYSGLGVYRNYNADTLNTIPKVFNRINPKDELSDYYKVDSSINIIVVNLGTNDFGPETQNPPNMLDSSLFVKYYISFIKELKNQYPKAKFVLCTGVALSNYWPAGLNRLDRSIRYVNAVAEVFSNQNSDIEVKRITLSTQTPPYGEDWHPNLKTHQKMSDEITPLIQKLLD